MRGDNVRRDGASDVQERAELASRSGASLREYSHRPLRKQGRRQRPKSQGENYHFPSQEEPSGLFSVFLSFEAVRSVATRGGNEPSS